MASHHQLPKIFEHYNDADSRLALTFWQTANARSACACLCSKCCPDPDGWKAIYGTAGHHCITSSTLACSTSYSNAMKHVVEHPPLPELLRFFGKKVNCFKQREMVEHLNVAISRSLAAPPPPHQAPPSPLLGPSPPCQSGWSLYLPAGNTSRKQVGRRGTLQKRHAGSLVS